MWHRLRQVCHQIYIIAAIYVYDANVNLLSRKLLLRYKNDNYNIKEKKNTHTEPAIFSYIM